mmetsp:Transcript_580/g.1547  ORF Transcript_580/g.1547 Transcript_580/m.1547 type:complete len:213 (+) Transcript_580:250-888(+)
MSKAILSRSRAAMALATVVGTLLAVLLLRASPATAARITCGGGGLPPCCHHYHHGVCADAVLPALGALIVSASPPSPPPLASPLPPLPLSPPPSLPPRCSSRRCRPFARAAHPSSAPPPSPQTGRHFPAFPADGRTAVYDVSAAVERPRGRLHPESLYHPHARLDPPHPPPPSPSPPPLFDRRDALLTGAITIQTPGPRWAEAPCPRARRAA